jgi:alanine dehydrogenase
MPLLLTEADVKSILTMLLVLEAVEKSFRLLADGSATLHPRQRLHLPKKALLHYMAATNATDGYMGLKIYSISQQGGRFLVTLFKDTGELVALIEADYLGQARTGAASGVATRLMARADARTVGIIGTGLQARTQLEAIANVRKLERIRAFGRDQQRREQFAAEMTNRLHLPVEPVASAEHAVRDADIIVTSTNSVNPVVEGRWLQPGMHINAIGSNFAHKRELDTEAVGRCDVIVADSIEQSKMEAGDLILAFGDDVSAWSKVQELADLVADKAPGRTDPRQITMFKSNGVATEDIVVAGRIYELARERKMGREVPMWEDEARSVVNRGV